MESPEEAMGSNSSNSNGNGGECTHGTSTATVVKGKRTKRQRNQPLALEAAMAVTDSSSASSADASGSITEEEEDMANCLILLAQGRALDAAGHKPESPAEEGGGTDKFTSRRFTEAATTTGGKAGFYVYECKTCSKCFPSFQALGGHRASHKKPRLAITAGEEKKPASSVEEDMLKISMNSFPKAMVSGGSTKPRVHECSICGSEFSSGQALGGHMRRHRPVVIPEAAEAKKERAILSLDLNLPAPSDDDRPELQRPSSPAFSFASKPPLIFPASASALVDCHY